MATKERSYNHTSPDGDGATAIIWDMNEAQFVQWVRSLPTFAQDEVFNEQLLPNLVTAVSPLVPNDGSSEPPLKCVKMEPSTTGVSQQQSESSKPPLVDPYNIWIGKPDHDQEVPATFGAFCLQLTQSGLLNALTLDGSSQVKTNDEQATKLSTALHRVIHIKMERDVLDTTPTRIRQMLCDNLSEGEFQAVRRRVHDTVILKKGMSSNYKEDTEAPVTARATDVEKIRLKKCKVCHNKDRSLFDWDSKNGDVICTQCATVHMESVVHEGSQFRTFAGEKDRNHHGNAANAHYSNAYNMSTTLGGTCFVHQGFGTQSKGLENKLRNVHAYTEINLSQFGRQPGEHRTRVGYKDCQKRNAFHQMTHVGDALNLHEAVVQQAKDLFADFRDDREEVKQYKEVIAACLCEAFDQLSSDGHCLLKMREQDTEALLETSKRANQRNELHHATMAGKGGLLLDFSHAFGGGENGDSKLAAAVKKSDSPMGATLALEKRPATLWDLNDCRSFLLESSRNIAQQWVKDRNNAGRKNIPEGSQAELEGKLVEHTMSLCDQLEAELKARDQKQAGGKKVITAGQLLIHLKTAEKLGSMLKDPVAGEAFHKELRALARRQEARKRKDMADEETRQRLQQMKRKPWLQARAEMDR